MNQVHVVLEMHLRIPEVFICIWLLQCLFALLLLLLAVRALYQVEWNWIIAADNSRRLPGNYLSFSQLHDWLPLVSLVWDPWGGLYNVHAKATIWCVWFYHRWLWGYPDCIPERRKKFSSQSNDGEEVTPCLISYCTPSCCGVLTLYPQVVLPHVFNLNFSEEKLSDTSHSSAHLFVPLFRCG